MATDVGGTRSWSTVLPPGRYAFRYLRDGEFVDDPDADEFGRSTSGRWREPGGPATSVARKRKPAAKTVAKTTESGTDVTDIREKRSK